MKVPAPAPRLQVPLPSAYHIWRRIAPQRMLHSSHKTAFPHLRLPNLSEIPNFRNSTTARFQARAVLARHNSAQPFLIANLTSKAMEWHCVLSLILCE